MPQNVTLVPWTAHLTLNQYLLSEQRAHILSALEEVHWNYLAASRLLGITYRALRYRVEQSGLIDKGWGGKLRAYAPRPADRSFDEKWKRLRWATLKRDGFSCQACGAKAKHGATLHVDHIKPRKHFPELALDQDNLQVLCAPCNLSKSAENDT